MLVLFQASGLGWKCLLEKPPGLPPVKSRTQGPSGAGAVAGAWSLCAGVAASAASCPGHIIPTDSPLGFKKARTFLPEGFGTRNTQSLGKMLLVCFFVVFFFFFSCESGHGVLSGSRCHSSFGVEEAWLKGQFSVHVSCPAFSWPSFFLETVIFQGQRVHSLGKGRNMTVTQVGWTQGRCSWAARQPLQSRLLPPTHSSVTVKQIRFLYE